MTIAGVTCGVRSPAGSDSPRYWSSTGFSMSGAVSTKSFGKRTHDLTITLRNISDATKILLVTACNGIRPGGAITIVGDSGDDLQVGDDASATFYFVGIRADAIAGKPLWDVTVQVMAIVELLARS